jgi:hypothetical protein
MSKMNGIFLESADENDEINGGRETVEGNELITEAAMELGLIDADSLSEAAELLSEKSIVKLDRIARMSHLRTQATMVLAREYDDLLYKRLAKLNREKALILAKLEAKYGNKAALRVKENIRAAAQSGTMLRTVRNAAGGGIKKRV